MTLLSLLQMIVCAYFYSRWFYWLTRSADNGALIIVGDAIFGSLHLLKHLQHYYDKVFDSTNALLFIVKHYLY